MVPRLPPRSLRVARGVSRRRSLEWCRAACTGARLLPARAGALQSKTPRGAVGEVAAREKTYVVRTGQRVTPTEQWPAAPPFRLRVGTYYLGAELDRGFALSRASRAEIRGAKLTSPLLSRAAGPRGSRPACRQRRPPWSHRGSGPAASRAPRSALLRPQRLP